MSFKKLVVIFSSILMLALASLLALYAGPISLSVSFGDPVITCNQDGAATVVFSYTVTSGNSSPATVTGQLDGGATFALPSISTWSTGQVKTADGSYTTTLSNGQHTLTVCADQPGTGSTTMHGCGSQTVTINCAVTEGCSNTDVFGEVPANKNLCLANGTIQIQFRGNFGDTAILEIEGPNNFSAEFAVDRAGDSCNYHYNWDPGTGNGGAGGYTFTVTGNNQTPLTFTATLECQTHGSN